MVHEIKKDREELNEQLTDTEKSDADTAIAAVEEAVKGDDVDAVKTAMEKLTTVAVSFAQKKQLNEQGQTPDAENDVVDATFTEKKDD